MRKEIIDSQLASDSSTTSSTSWLDLESLARVEVSSEDDLFPIEHALQLKPTTGWRASAPGPQVIRLIFDAPQTIRRIELHIIERVAERSQEFSFHAGPAPADLREVVRQQFTFSPRGSSEEVENYSFTLDQITILELRIDPDRSHDPATSVNYASIASLKVG